MNSAQQRKLRRGLRKLEHSVFIHKTKHLDAMQWCNSQIGKRWDIFVNRDGAWTCVWAGQDAYELYKFCFAEDADAVLFTLKWM
jgi:hypothetical protein